MDLFFSIKNQIKEIVVYPGVKISYRNYKIKKVLNKKPSLLYVGRLDDQKDLKTIIKAFQYITQQLRNKDQIGQLADLRGLLRIQLTFSFKYLIILSLL